MRKLSNVQTTHPDIQTRTCPKVMTKLSSPPRTSDSLRQPHWLPLPAAAPVTVSRSTLDGVTPNIAYIIHKFSEISRQVFCFKESFRFVKVCVVDNNNNIKQYQF